MKKRMMAVLLGLSMFGSFLAGCGNGTENKTEKDTSVEKEDEEKRDNDTEDSKEPLEISIVLYNEIGYPPVADTETQKLLEERFNVKFDVQIVDLFNSDQWNLFWAQGNTADVINVGWQQEKKLWEEGLIREISVDDMYEYMPNYMALSEEIAGGKDALLESMSLYGKYCCIPMVGESMGVPVFVRKDWMDKCGIKEVKTLEDFEKMLDAFTYGDPDGNGVDDTYAIHAGEDYAFSYVYGAYGLFPHTKYVKDDEIVFADVQPEYKEILKLLAKWYEAGYIDMESATDDRELKRNKWSEGKLGIIHEEVWWAESGRGSSGVIQMLTEKNENAVVEMLPLFENPSTGEKGLLACYTPAYDGGGSLYFGENASDEVVHKMMEIKEALVTDKELYLRVLYGVEGEDYTLENGKLVISDDSTSETRTQKGIGTFFGQVTKPIEWKSLEVSDEDAEMENEVREIMAEGKIVWINNAYSISGTNEANEIKGEDVSRIAKEYFWNALTGRIDVDETWDDYVEELRDAGLDEIMEEENALWVK